MKMPTVYPAMAVLCLRQTAKMCGGHSAAGCAGRVPRGGVGAVDLRRDRIQVRRPVLAS
jgi:hypothetical protein